MEEEKEPVEFSFDTKDFKNYIKDIYFEFERPTAIMFTRKKDTKVLWLPKSTIKGGVKKDKTISQNVKLNFSPKELYWVKRRKKFYLDGKWISVP